MTSTERQAWLAHFKAHPDLTVAKAVDNQQQALIAEGWRWGWEKNNQIKTDPMLGYAVAPLIATLDEIHKEAHA